MEFLKVENLCKVYGKGESRVTALDHVSLTIEKGEILLIGKARGSRQGNNLLVEKIRACGGIDFQLPILLGYTGLTDVFLKKYVEDSRALWENGVDGLEFTLIGGVIGTHAGPGAIAVAFFRRG